MSIRITCPSCDASYPVDDEKAGKKIRCRKCEEVVAVPAASSKRKRDDEMAVQEKRKVRVKSRARDEQDDDDEDEDEDRRGNKKSTKAKSGVPVLLLALGGGGALLFVLLGGGIVGWLVMRSPAGPEKIAQGGPRPLFENNAEPVVIVPKKFGPIPGNVVVGPKDRPKPANPAAGKALPAALGLDDVHRVKAATLYLRVTMGDNNRATGTGFLAMEPGLIVTNAHVVGMLARNAPLPKDIEAILHSGQANELIMKAKLVAVDRLSDLAFLRVEQPNLPPYLQVDGERKMVETQKVWIFGFPKGELLGKEITVSESSVSSFRRDPRTKELSRIQVNGGMQPGNSGGPVVNALGDVIGVAVSGYEGTPLNFAVPGEKLIQAMEGRVSETRLGQAFVDNNQLKLPVKLVCVDPLKKISQLKVEVWNGPPGQARGYSMSQPPAQAGDGPRTLHTISYQGGIGTFDVPLPQPNPGQVCWVQPVITNAVGTHWAPAVAAPAELYPIERKPANLMVNLEAQKYRTVKFKSSNGMVETRNDEQKTVLARKLDLEFLEELVPTTPPSAKTRIRTSFGATKIGIELLGKTIDVDQATINLFRSFPPGFSVDKTNRLVERSVISSMSPKFSPQMRANVLGMQSQMYNSIEAITMPMPNRTVQPLESWQVKMPYMEPQIDPGMKAEQIDLVINCTYQGTRMRDARAEAVITLSGTGQRRGKNAGYTGADVTGRIGFDVDGGFISFERVRISYDAGVKADGTEMLDSLDIELDRQAGNPLNIPTPKDLPAAIVAKGKVLLNTAGILGVQGNLAIPSPNPLMKGNVPAIATPPLKLVANKTYVITLDSNQFDAYLIVQDATGKAVAEDDDGGGTPANPLNARIEFRCPASGNYRVILTTHDGKGGQFQFKIQEAQ